METRCLIIDGNSLVYRAAYAKPDLTTKQGLPTGGIHLFFIMLNNILTKVRPTHLVVAFDVGRETFRTQLSSRYKANRHSPSQSHNSLKFQLKEVERLLDQAHILTSSASGFEADDVIGTWVTLSTADQNFILSGDRDVFQLIDEKTRVFFPKTGISDLRLFDLATFQTEFGIEVQRYVDYKVLCGDASDNITGCPGCGPKTAVKLINQYGSLENIYQHLDELKGKLRESLIHYQPQVELTKTLVTIRRDVSLPYSFKDARFAPQWNNLLPRLNELELNTVARKIQGGDFYA